MNIVITGATGFIGQYVVRAAQKQGHNITIITRHQGKAEKIYNHSIKIIEHDLNNSSLSLPLQDITGAINLMGENLAAKRWSPQQKEKIIFSRLQTTKNFITSLPPTLATFVSASALGIYAPNSSTPANEEAPPAHDFLGGLCQQWEDVANSSPGRTVCLRIGAALGKEGGILAPLLPLFKLGLGGAIAEGNQYISWMHVEDLANVFVTAIENTNYQGAINAVVDPPVSNREFTNVLANTLSRPAFLTVPRFALQLLLGRELGELATTSQFASGEKLRRLGFIPRYGTLHKAFNTL